MYDGRLYTVIFYDEDGYVLTVNDEEGWKILPYNGQLVAVPEEVYSKYIGKKGWWFPVDVVKQDFKPISVENV